MSLLTADQAASYDRIANGVLLVLERSPDQAPVSRHVLGMKLFILLTEEERRLNVDRYRLLGRVLQRLHAAHLICARGTGGGSTWVLTKGKEDAM